MSDPDLDSLLVLLAILGAVALAARAVRGLLRLALRAAEETAASGLAEVSERRGDLTGLAERRTQLAAARALRRRELGSLALWLLWLALPPILGWLPEGYAVASALWLVRPLTRSTRAR